MTELVQSRQRVWSVLPYLLLPTVSERFIWFLAADLCAYNTHRGRSMRPGGSPYCSRTQDPCVYTSKYWYLDMICEYLSILK